MNSAIIWLYLKKTVLLRTTNSQKEINKIATEILHKKSIEKVRNTQKCFYMFFISQYHIIEHF